MNKNHLRRLRDGTAAWNEWRRRSATRPDLADAEINFLASKSTLPHRKSVFARFEERSFYGVDLHDADLRRTKIWNSDLGRADLRGADLRGAEIRRSRLAGADLREADLRGAQWLASDLTGCRLDTAILGHTHFGFTPLIDVYGLDQVQHRTPSYVDHFSIIRSAPLSVSFLAACGVSSHTIRMAELYLLSRPQHTCFISYSRRDEPFVGYLREWLTWHGVPSWFAPQDMRNEELQGTPAELQRDLYTYVDEAERVLLVISPHILPSGWVAKEFQRARHSLNLTSIIPILIDDMPEPDSVDWATLIDRTIEDVEDRQLDPHGYSNELKLLLSGHALDLRGWRAPSILVERLPALLPRLQRSS
jgi:TIR domain-containing protein/pentapeptide repeat protein